MSLKPFEEGGNIGLLKVFADKLFSKEKVIDLAFPSHLAELRLNRVFRCTNNIKKFYEAIVRKSKQPDFHISSKININSTSYISGHEIYGEPPEILLLPQCLCLDSCYMPLNHLFLRHKLQIISFIKKAILKCLHTELIIIVDTFPTSKECSIFLKKVLDTNNLSDKVIIKDTEKCRGLEYPALMTITNDSNRGVRSSADCNVIDAWTRVTSSLFIIHMEGENTL